MTPPPRSSRAASSPAIDAPHRRRLPPLLRRAWYGLNQTFRRRLAPLGLTPDQFTILRWLTEFEEGLTQRQLAELMASDANTITALVTRMSRARWLVRRRHETDRRANRVLISASGRRLFLQGRALAAELQERAMAAIPARQRETFLANLERLAKACRAELEQTPSGGGRDKAKR